MGVDRSLVDAGHYPESVDHCQSFVFRCPGFAGRYRDFGERLSVVVCRYLGSVDRWSASLAADPERCQSLMFVEYSSYSSAPVSNAASFREAGLRRRHFHLSFVAS